MSLLRLLSRRLCLVVVPVALASGRPVAAQVNQVPPAEWRFHAILDGVHAQRDLPYVEQGQERQKLDLYVPKEGGPFPVVIWVHGGGWQNGNKDNCPPLRAGFTQQGFAVASLGYRLTDQAQFPAQLEDCKAAIRWLRAHAKELRLDPKRFGVWGSSAGGHLAALLGTTGDVKEFDVGPNLDQSSRVQAVCDYYGPTDFTVFATTPGFESHGAPGSPESKLLGGTVLDNKDKAARANSIAYVTADDPQFLIVHGDEDKTVPLNQSQLLFDALKSAGVPVQLHTIHGAGHGGPGFNGPEINNLVTGFFETTLMAPPTPHTQAIKTESTAAATSSPAQPGPAAADAPAARPGVRGMPVELILQREDKNGDGKVSREEFRGPPQLFERWDTNKDGFLIKEEFEAGMAVAPGK